MIPRPPSNEHSTYFGKYIELVKESDALDMLMNLLESTSNVYSSLTEAQQNFRYAEGKWSPKQILSHIIDTERGMGYRAMCVARGDTQNLPNMDENLFAVTAHADERTMQSLVDEYRAVRVATISLFKDSIPAEALGVVGTVNGYPMSARAQAWIIAGHDIHHTNILHERYLNH